MESISKVLERKQQEIEMIWIIGLSSAGKTTLADLLVNKLKQNGHPCLHIDGTQTRNIFETKLGFDPDSRRKQTRRIKSIAQWVSQQGIIPVVAIIHPFRQDRDWCRNELSGYYEVYLKCSIDECRRRDEIENKNVYKIETSKDIQNVVGLDIKYDEPEDTDLILESDKLNPDELLNILWGNVSRLIVDNKLGN